MNKRWTADKQTANQSPSKRRQASAHWSATPRVLVLIAELSLSLFWVTVILGQADCPPFISFLPFCLSSVSYWVKIFPPTGVSSGFFLARWSVALPLYKSASSLPSSSSSSDSASQQAASLPGLVSTKLINILTKQPPLHTKSAEATDFSPLFAAHSITAPLPQWRRRRR